MLPANVEIARAFSCGCFSQAPGSCLARKAALKAAAGRIARPTTHAENCTAGNLSGIGHFCLPRLASSAQACSGPARGANAVIALRCCRHSRQLDDHREHRRERLPPPCRAPSARAPNLGIRPPNPRSQAGLPFLIRPVSESTIRPLTWPTALRFK
jgi:hypothetical protein